MIIISGKKLCENCFAEAATGKCSVCGFSALDYVPEPSVLPCGTMLHSRYVIGRVIGRGGFGITYLAYDTKNDIRIAVKEFYPNNLALRGSGDPVVAVTNQKSADIFKRGAEKFYEEAQIVSKFNGNPNIVSVYDFFYENDTVYYTMEYIEGRSLKDYIKNAGVLTAGQTVFAADKVSSALMVAHSAGVLHRDVSPDNIMVCSDGNIKLIDFGAARQVVANSSQFFSVIFKPGFAPLEQYQKKGKQGPWTDIYSLGETMFYMLTEKIPDDPMSRLDDDSIHTVNSYLIDDKLWNIIRRATMLKTEERYRDIFEFRKELADSGIAAVPLMLINTESKAHIPSGATAKPYSGTAHRSVLSSVQQDMTRTLYTEFEPAPVPAAKQNGKTETSARSEKSDEPNKPKNKKKGGAKAAMISVMAVLAVCALSAGVGMIYRSEKEQPAVSDASVSETSEEKSGTETEQYSASVTTEAATVTHAATETVTVSETLSEASAEGISLMPDFKGLKSGEAISLCKKLGIEYKMNAVYNPAAEPGYVFSQSVKAGTVLSDVSYVVIVIGKQQEASASVTETTVKNKQYVTICGGNYELGTTVMKLYNCTLNENDIENLSKLVSLKTLVLNNNNLSDISFISNFKNLEILDLHDNQIKDISSLKSLTNLNELYLYSNQIQDISPLENLTKLNYLELEQNQIKDISVLQNLKQLNGLLLWTNNIQDISPLKNLTNLTKLGLGDNQIQDISPLKNLTNLNELGLEVNRIQDISSLKSLTKINKLWLNNNQIKDISSLKNLTELQELELEQNQIKDISVLQNLKQLNRLILWTNNIQDISPLKNLTNLTELGLGDNQIQDISPLKNLTNLNELGLWENQIQDISPLKNLANLNVLGLGGNQIQDISPLKNLTKLNELGLGENQVQDISSLKDLTKLNKLWLENNQIKDISSLKNLTNLIELTINGNPIVDSQKSINELKSELTACTIK